MHYLFDRHVKFEGASRFMVALIFYVDINGGTRIISDLVNDDEKEWIHSKMDDLLEWLNN